ncbi:hypothetical protein CH35J_003940 [Colletotrichum higginsianum]|uniref:C2H2-type domain-containing protein n=1 Tax=Colletotrichum higginsianum TaxID=80884 RepID=A0A4T0W928_9PEZI|nr:hypothetical protein CH35J_003940 [Colletotrichum higginsianum]
MAVDHPSPPATFKCHEPGCESKPFASPSNLKRHAKAKHGPKVTMPCGKKRSDHSSNNKRHEKSCRPCQQARGDAVSAVKQEEQTSPAHGGTGYPSDATEEVGVPFDFDPCSPYDPFWDLQHDESSF